MKKRTRRIATTLLALLAVGTIAIVAFIWWTGQPWYRPGMVRAGENLRGSLEPPDQSGDPAYWDVEGDIRLFHFAKGSGSGFPLLFLHGGPGYPIEEPLPALALLEGSISVNYYHQRGCGKSSRPFDRFSSKNRYENMKTLEETLGIGAQVADVERIRRILGKDQVVLLGHSFGAFLATLYAAEFPEHVAALVLVAPSGVLVMPSEEDGFFEIVRRELPSAKRDDFDALLTSYLDFGSLFEKSEQELSAMNREMGDYFLLASGVSQQARVPASSCGGWMVQAMYLSMGRRHDYRSALKHIACPTLVVHGADDILPDRFSRQYADLIPNAKMSVLKSAKTRGIGSGHFALSSRSEELTKLISQFLEPIVGESASGETP